MSQPTTRQPLSQQKGLGVTLQRVKTRSQDLCKFSIDSLLPLPGDHGVPKRWQRLTDKSCCVRCSQVKVEENFHQYNDRTMESTLLTFMSNGTSYLQSGILKRKQVTKKPVGEAVERALCRAMEE